MKLKTRILKEMMVTSRTIEDKMVFEIFREYPDLISAYETHEDAERRIQQLCRKYRRVKKG